VDTRGLTYPSVCLTAPLGSTLEGVGAPTGTVFVQPTFDIAGPGYSPILIPPLPGTTSLQACELTANVLDFHHCETGFYGIETHRGQGSQVSQEPGSPHKRAPREIARDTEAATAASLEAVKRFAKRLNQLFDTVVTESGRPYTLTEVAQATGLSVSHLSILRSGKITSVPSFDRVEALARFFNVTLDYFSENPRPYELDEEMRRTLAKPLVRDVALRAGNMGMPERALMLQMMEQADLLLAHMKGAAGSEPNKHG